MKLNFRDVGVEGQILSPRPIFSNLFPAAMRDLPRLTFILIAMLGQGLVHADDAAPKTFKVWVFADAHVDTDKRNGRESLATALTQSEGPAGFAWDIALDLGDSGAQGTPKDAEGQEIVRQFKCPRATSSRADLRSIR